METTTFKVLTIRDLEGHSEMLKELMNISGQNSASKALIKAGHDYIRTRELLEAERRENKKLRQKIREFEEGTSMFFKGLSKMEKAINNE